MPEYGRAWQEQGHLALARGDEAEALGSFIRATRFNPALEASWRGQLAIFEARGRERQAVQIRAQLERRRGKAEAL